MRRTIDWLVIAILSVAARPVDGAPAARAIRFGLITLITISTVDIYKDGHELQFVVAGHGAMRDYVFSATAPERCLRWGDWR